MSSAVPLAAAAVLDVGTALTGLRSYIAVAGGIALRPVLGSCSTDVLSGLGPPALRAGDSLPIGVPQSALGPVDADHGQAGRRPGGPLVLTITPGPRQDWFTAGSLATLVSSQYRASKDSNRIALRLDGPAVERTVTAELPSEGLVLGAVQVPADGQPLVFLADHPTTGGYPVIAVVDDSDIGACARCVRATRSASAGRSRPTGRPAGSPAAGTVPARDPCRADPRRGPRSCRSGGRHGVPGHRR